MGNFKKILTKVAKVSSVARNVQSPTGGKGSFDYGNILPDVVKDVVKILLAGAVVYFLITGKADEAETTKDILDSFNVIQLPG